MIIKFMVTKLVRELYKENGKYTPKEAFLGKFKEVETVTFVTSHCEADRFTLFNIGPGQYKIGDTFCLDLSKTM